MSKCCLGGGARKCSALAWPVPRSPLNGAAGTHKGTNSYIDGLCSSSRTEASIGYQLPIASHRLGGVAQVTSCYALGPGRVCNGCPMRREDGAVDSFTQEGPGRRRHPERFP